MSRGQAHDVDDSLLAERELEIAVVLLQRNRIPVSGSKPTKKENTDATCKDFRRSERI
jgi:hypothetical protein